MRRPDQRHPTPLGPAHQTASLIAVPVCHPQTVSGVNTYAILQAPKTDGAEAVVLSASWLSRALDSEGNKSVNRRGVATLLAVANYLKSEDSADLYRGLSR